MINNQEKKVTDKAYAYTPGLKIKKNIIIRKLRRLPVSGKVLVKVGDDVDFSSPIAEAMIPGEPNVINAAAELGVPRESLYKYMIKKEGDEIKKGEDIAGYNSFFGLWKNWLKSPIDGYIERISDVSGQIILREAPIRIDVKGYLRGKVVEVLENEGAVIETNASFVQGIFGIGGENKGKIMVVTEKLDEYLIEDLITPNCKGKIIVGGACLTLEAFHKAVKLGVSGIVTGGINDIELKDLLGYELGIAITGHEEVNTTLVITEGFGEMRMNPKIIELFKDYEGKIAAINGTTQIRAGVLRPEVIIPHGVDTQRGDLETLSGGMVEGTQIRVIREPYFGRFGKVISLPVELQIIETRSKVRVIEIELDDGEIVIIPRANVEIIET
jgi:hypothetical protein